MPIKYVNKAPHSVWKLPQKSNSTLRAKRASFIFRMDKQSNSVTRQVTFNRTEIGGKCQNCKNATFWEIFQTLCSTLILHYNFSMYDVDGNGYIDLSEMTKIVKSIYNMMGPNHVAMDQFESPEARAKGIFARMDVNSDGKVTKTEFVRCCLEDQKLIELLTPMSANT